MNRFSSAQKPLPRRWGNGSALPLDADIEAVRLPMDLRGCLGTARLRRLIEEELEKLDWANPRVVRHLERHPQYRPRTMLRILSFAYGTEVFSSDEISKKCHSDAVFQSLCEGSPPFPDELRSFRLKNRKVIETILVRVFKRVAEETSRSPFFTSRQEAFLMEQAIERLDIARHMDRIEY